MPPDVVQQLDEELALQADLHDRAVPFISPRQQNFKWGGCPYHLQSSLQPHILRSGRFQGHIMLRCSRFWKREEQAVAVSVGTASRVLEGSMIGCLRPFEWSSSH